MDLNTVHDVVVAADRSVLLDWQPGDAWLGGGTALFGEPNLHLRRLVDLAGFAWPALTVTEAGLEIAATCTLAELAAFDRNADPASRPWSATDLFAQCCRALLGSFKVQNMATVGGNLCSALPAGPMIALAVALDGRCLIWGPDGDRTIPAADFVLGPEQTALVPGELLRSIFVPARALSSATAFRQQSLSTLGRSAVLVIGSRSHPDQSDRTDAVTITVTASTPRPVQLRFAEYPSADEVQSAVREQITAYYDDVHGSPAWRRHLTALYTDEVRRELAAL